MFRKYVLPALAIIGATIGILIAFWSQKEVPPPPILFPPPTSPYAYSIAGAGIIEASSQNISIGTPFNEIVTNVYVVEGDYVQEGDVLFVLDLRAFESQAESAAASLELALVEFENNKVQYSFYQRLYDARAVSEQAYAQAYYNLLEAEENVNIAKANLLEVETNIDRSIIRSPINGQVLQVNIHVGEIALISPFTSDQSLSTEIQYGNLIYLGVVDPLQMRIDIDEDDSWRYRAGAAATAFVRGNSTINFPLKFSRIEPLYYSQTFFYRRYHRKS